MTPDTLSRALVLMTRPHDMCMCVQRGERQAWKGSTDTSGVCWGKVIHLKSKVGVIMFLSLKRLLSSSFLPGTDTSITHCFWEMCSMQSAGYHRSEEHVIVPESERKIVWETRTKKMTELSSSLNLTQFPPILSQRERERDGPRARGEVFSALWGLVQVSFIELLYFTCLYTINDTDELSAHNAYCSYTQAFSRWKCTDLQYMMFYPAVHLY